MDKFIWTQSKLLASQIGKHWLMKDKSSLVLFLQLLLRIYSRLFHYCSTTHSAHWNGPRVLVTIRLFHVIIHMIPALVTCHLMNVWIKNLISSHKLYCPSKVRLETLSRFRLYVQHTFPPIMPMAGDPYQADPYHSHSWLYLFFYVSS